MKIKKLLTFCLILLSCNNGAKIKKDLDKLCSHPIIITTDMTVNYNGLDGIIDIFKNSDLKFVVYTDSVSCSSCSISKMYLWQPFLEYANTFGERLQFYFIFYPPKSGIDVLHTALKNNQLNYPILIDENGDFEKLNPHLPKNKAMHTFLLDENNKVILVGNPLQNKEIEKLFYKKTQELLSK